jgi:hydroxymethylpyrimidine/phosphomethylpyrimidine kinase
MKSSARPLCLTIGGSDPSGGAGIQRDLKTFADHDVDGVSVITLLTAQNARAVRDIQYVDAYFVSRQMDTLLEAVTPDAIKTGALGSAEVVEVILEWLRGRHSPLIVDPVIYSSSGQRLLEETAEEKFLKKLISMAYLVTPNIPEAEWITGRKITQRGDIEDAAKAISDLGAKAVLIKGGHLPSKSQDYLYEDNTLKVFSVPPVEKVSIHGTGCILSSAIAAGLAKRTPLYDTLKQAKQYVLTCLK